MRDWAIYFLIKKVRVWAKKVRIWGEKVRVWAIYFLVKKGARLGKKGAILDNNRDNGVADPSHFRSDQLGSSSNAEFLNVVLGVLRHVQLALVSNAMVGIPGQVTTVDVVAAHIANNTYENGGESSLLA